MSVLRTVRRRKQKRRLGKVRVVRREDYAGVGAWTYRGAPGRSMHQRREEQKAPPVFTDGAHAAR